MKNTHNIYLISDSTGETLERIFMALKAQFENFKHKLFHYSFTRTENQILKILEEVKKKEDSIILYTIVDNKLAKYLSQEANKKNIPCFGVLGDLILNFSKLLNQEATNIPSGQHAMNEEYYKRIEAVQFTMNHDDGNSRADVHKSDIILLGVSRTSKTPTSIYLANRGYKTSNIPLIDDNSIPEELKKNPKTCCVVGLIAEPKRIYDVRKNRLTTIKEQEAIQYTNLETIQNEIEESRKTFKKYQWPIIDVTRKSVEETAASVIKIYEIFSSRK